MNSIYIYTTGHVNSYFHFVIVQYKLEYIYQPPLEIDIGGDMFAISHIVAMDN